MNAPELTNKNGLKYFKKITNFSKKQPISKKTETEMIISMKKTRINTFKISLKYSQTAF